jgi:hypothetical protein
MHTAIVMKFIEILESLAWIALGFVPTLVFLEMSWRMGKVIGRRRRRMTGILQQKTIR